MPAAGPEYPEESTETSPTTFSSRESMLINIHPVCCTDTKPPTSSGISIETVYQRGFASAIFSVEVSVMSRRDAFQIGPPEIECRRYYAADELVLMLCVKGAHILGTSLKTEPSLGWGRSEA